MDRIVLKNMGFFGYHGDLSSENELGQRFFVDVTLLTDLTKAGQSDSLEDSINYVEIHKMVRQIMEGEPYHLLEKVATVIADSLWNEFKGIVGLSVSVRKPSAPIAGMIDYAEVTVNRGQM